MICMITDVNYYTAPVPRFITVAMIAISAGITTFFIISQSGGRITPVGMTDAIPAEVCYLSNFCETGPRSIEMT